MIIFFIKALVIFCALIFIRYWIDKLNYKKIFSFVSWERFAGTLLSQQAVQCISDRWACLGLGFLNLSILPTALLMMITTFLLCHLGYFSELAQVYRSTDDQNFFFLIMDSSLLGLFISFLIGFIPVIIWARSGFSFIVTCALMFFGLISVPGSILIVLGEFFALYIYLMWQASLSGLRKDVYYRVLSFSVSLVSFVAFGWPLRSLLAAVVTSQGLNSRFYQW